MKFLVKPPSWLKLVILLGILTGASELVLRFGFGLGHPPLMLADPQLGYRFQPNQTLRRFGKRIEYNQYSQRSEPIQGQKPPQTLRLLMVGDSILNGGSPTDQMQTITELFESQIKAQGHKAEVLNASAGSWGLGNHLAYLRQFGILNSDAVILEIGSHDLTQPTSTSDRVGQDPNYPDHPPALAMQEAWTRYLWPKVAGNLGINGGNPDPRSDIPSMVIDSQQQFQQNQRSLAAAIALIRQQQIPVFVLFVPELGNLVPRSLPPEDKAAFLQQLQALQVPVIDVQTAWSRLPPPTLQTYFRDGLHLTVTGHQAIADLLFQQLCIQQQLPACLKVKP